MNRILYYQRFGSEEWIGFFPTKCSVGKNILVILRPHHFQVNYGRKSDLLLKWIESTFKNLINLVYILCNDREKALAGGPAGSNSAGDLCWQNTVQYCTNGTWQCISPPSVHPRWQRSVSISLHWLNQSLHCFTVHRDDLKENIKHFFQEYFAQLISDKFFLS